MRSRAGPRLVFGAVVSVALFAFGAVTAGATFVDSHNLQSATSQLPETSVLTTVTMIATVAGNGGIDAPGIALAALSGVLAAVPTLPQVSADASPMPFTAVFAMVAIVVGGLAGGPSTAF
jgi:simple sugar transport system permease protein